MLVIRLQRAGKKKQAFFRVVLQEKTWKTQGKALELLGFYNPHTKEKNFQIERIKHWLSKGAQASPTVHNLLIDEKIIEGEKVKSWRPKRKPVKEQAEVPTESKASVGEEGPTEDKAPTQEDKQEAPKDEKPAEKPAEPEKEKPQASQPKAEEKEPTKEEAKEPEPQKAAPANIEEKKS